MNAPEALCTVYAFLKRLERKNTENPTLLPMIKRSLVACDVLAQAVPCQTPFGPGLEGWIATFDPPPTPPLVAALIPPAQQTPPKNTVVNLEVEEFLRGCQGILDDLPDLPDGDAAISYRENTEEKITKMMETATRNQSLLHWHQDALEKTRAGLDKWLHR